MTSANKKLSCTFSNDPPFAALTSEISENPWPTLVVAFIATKASHAQSWYIVLPSALSADRSQPNNSDDCLTGDSVSVVETFDNFWTQIVQRIGDVEAIRVVKRFVGRVHPSSIPAKRFWAYSCKGRVVQIVTAVDECKSKIDIILSVKY